MSSANSDGSIDAVVTTIVPIRAEEGGVTLPSTIEKHQRGGTISKPSSRSSSREKSDALSSGSRPGSALSESSCASQSGADDGLQDRSMVKYNLTRDLTVDERLEEIGGPMPLLKFTPNIEVNPVACGIKRRKAPLRDVVFDLNAPETPEPVYTIEENVKNLHLVQEGEVAKRHNEIVYIRPDAHKDLCHMEDIEDVPRVVDVHKEIDAKMPKLVFDSVFESGNLLKATLVEGTKTYHEYDLCLQNDLLTNGHTQWFYFSVTNAPKYFRVKFNIINMRKSGSLYNDGMQPCTYSMFANEKGLKKSKGWRRKGVNISYSANKAHPRLGLSDLTRKWYNLSWVHEFEYGKSDTVYFAMAVPYTFSDLRRDLTILREDEQRQQHIVYKKLCDSIAGNEVPLLTITARKETVGEGTNRRYIVISARVHPGETNASWMMRGILFFLTSDDPRAKTLRENFVFKIIPMLNPDGVINGNYRCNLSGVDLNRRWRATNKFLHPTIWHLKQLIATTRSKRNLEVYLDLHGHSRKKNVFMYGCCKRPEAGEAVDYSALRLPYLQELVSPSFSFMSSSFRVSKSKAGTARVVTWKELGVRYSYTIEASFCGASIGSKAGQQFRTSDLEEIGSDCCKTMIEFFKLPGCTEISSALPLMLRPKSVSSSRGSENESKAKGAIAVNEKLIESMICGGTGAVADDGSASDVSDDNMNVSQRNSLMQSSVNPSSLSKKSKIFKKKKRTRSKKVRATRRYSTLSKEKKEKDQDLPEIPKPPAQKRPDVPPANVAYDAERRRLSTAEFLRLRVEKSIAKKSKSRVVPTTNIGLGGSSPMFQQYHLDPNYQDGQYNPPVVNSNFGGMNPSNITHRPSGRHGIRQSTGSSNTFMLPSSPISSDSQFGTMNTVTAIRALKQALAKGETSTSGFGDVLTSQNARKFGKDFPDPTLRIKRSPSYNDILRNSGKNFISSSFVNTEKKLSGFMKKEKSSSSFFGRSVSPIRRSIMEKAGKNKRAQVKARLSLQTFELPNGRFK